ncbi:MAG: SRPBCC family protein [bacterium]
MKKRIFEKESVIEAPARKVFDWHKTDDALEKLIPPGDPVSVGERNGSIKDDDTVVLKIGFGPFSMNWLARHQNYEEGRQFEDVQVEGPFAHWVHTHEVIPEDESRCRLRDHVEYAVPFGALGDFLFGWFVRRKLQSMFEYRHSVTREELENQD